MRIAIGMLVAVLLPFAPAAGQEVPAEPDPEAATAKAIERGLAWLAANQQKDGAWSGNVGFRRADDYVVEGDADHPGVTALATFAFLGTGATPGEGRDGKALARGLESLARAADDDGMIAANGTRMMSHGLALFALALSQRMHPDEDRARVVRAASHFSAKTQNRAGGWCYAPYSRESDLVATTGQLLALLEARDAGARVPGFVIDRALAYVLRAVETSPGDHEGMFHYQQSPDDGYARCTHALTAAGLHSILRAGLDTDEGIAAFVDAKAIVNPGPAAWPPRIDAIVKVVRDLPPRTRKNRFEWLYGSFHAARALAIRGGDEFTAWFDRTRKELLESQREDGSWPSADVGRPFATAIATTILLIPEGHLPANPR